MKRMFSLILAIIIALSCFMPAGAQSTVPSRYPVVTLYGDGEAITDSEGNILFKFSNLLNSFSSTEDGKTEEAIRNVLLPFLTEGVLTGNYEPYYAALEKEIGDVFESVRLDHNGNICTDSGLSPEKKELMSTSGLQKNLYEDSFYLPHYFFYDWRLDPFEIADKLNDYIEQIKQTTGKTKVNINAYCLGSNVVLAYIAKYGTGSIHSFGMDGSVLGGTEIISEVLSGRFEIDGNALDRFLSDLEALGMVNINDFARSSIDLLIKTGILDGATEAFRRTIYKKIIEGVTSALAVSTFFTWPMYWSAIKAEDYERCKEYVFGKPGSEKRTEYAGLIAKTDHYHETVRLKIKELLQKVDDECTNLAILSKYGFQIAPFCESKDVIGDQYVSVNSSSFGATTSDVYSVLSDEYIEERIRQGKGEYISPDKQIDASTCLFPDNTWFIKDSSHSHWSEYECDLLYFLTASETKADIHSFEKFPQFAVYDKLTDYAVKMTEENCNTYHWTADKKEENPRLLIRIINFYELFFKWIKTFLAFLSEKIAVKAVG